MAGIIFILLGIAGLGTAFILFYKLYWEKRIDRSQVEEMLTKHGIGFSPEEIVKGYYKTKGLNKSDKEVKKLTKQFISNDKEFFLTMWEQSKR